MCDSVCTDTHTHSGSGSGSVPVWTVSSSSHFPSEDIPELPPERSCRYPLGVVQRWHLFVRERRASGESLNASLAVFQCFLIPSCTRGPFLLNVLYLSLFDFWTLVLAGATTCVHRTHESKTATCTWSRQRSCFYDVTFQNVLQHNGSYARCCLPAYEKSECD